MVVINSLAVLGDPLTRRPVSHCGRRHHHPQSLYPLIMEMQDWNWQAQKKITFQSYSHEDKARLATFLGRENSSTMGGFHWPSYEWFAVSRLIAKENNSKKSIVLCLVEHGLHPIKKGMGVLGVESVLSALPQGTRTSLALGGGRDSRACLANFKNGERMVCF